MKRFVMNKNVTVIGGVAYVAGQEIKAGMPGFEDMVKAGHCDVQVFHGEGESVNESPAPEASPEMSADEEAPKKGRKGHK